ncbi:DNA uptake/competence protein ComA [Legionella adelaidensis]|uniref:DNA uptake/competence protein ComA n=1 Tax=Legionella adelaidensis TaxID=45056 RepID=A0A0W0R496_9GAMM|nr:DNA internalization-related competence protein ComEC/Rec2 [Legionella adelaidensis]KTC65894.1 DNA uptake/competence protein ComA [Legionella adelaidensis]
MEILLFFAGITVVIFKSYLPFVFVLLVLFFRLRVRYIAWFLAGIAWGYSHEWYSSDWNMPKGPVIKQADIKGYISSIPVKTKNKTQFEFQLISLDDKVVKAKLLVNCYQRCPLVSAGELWRFKARLKKPHNLNNPGSFDYKKWLLTRHITWTATLLPAKFCLIPHGKINPLLRYREHLAAALNKLPLDETSIGVLQALTLGITTAIDKSDWDLFRRTGTVHLMVISGAHVGLVAGLAFYSSKWLWGFVPQLALRYPAQKIASLAALWCASLYTSIAGFGVPAQRALIVCCFLFGRNFFQRRVSTWQSWRYALLLVILLEPHSVALSGFYLSFLAVSILILVNSRFEIKGIKKTLVLQVACLVGLMPLTLFWFSYGSINGLLANLIAIPWVSFIIVPLGLFITLTAQWFVLSPLVDLLKESIQLLLQYLLYVDHFQTINLHFTFTGLISALILLFTLILCIFMPIGKILPAYITLIFTSFFKLPPSIKPGEVQIDILDVGQGLAVLARTAHHNLIYDTGMKFFHGADMGKLVLIPYLNALQIKVLDTVVISHPDLDHRGGLPSLREEIPIKSLVVNDPGYYKEGRKCHEYQPWIWDGVSFSFFSIKGHFKNKNNNSCVLKISTTGGSVLLTGDIEKEAEHYLETNYGKKIAANVLVVPHHGSKTSSSLSFIKKINPDFAIFSYGFDNPYHFPHQTTLLNYKQIGTHIYNTADHGMVSVRLQRHTYSVSGYL